MGFFGWGSSSNGVFVRADITYLKQDYSVMLQAVEAGAPRQERRYDLFVRERLATPADAAAAVTRRQAGLTRQQRAVLFALRELAGQDPQLTRR